MSNDYSDIGFQVASNEDLNALAQALADEAEVIEAGEGRYYRWSCAQGPEMWLYVDGENRLSAVTPHFCGPSRMRVRLESVIQRDEDGPRIGAYQCWSAPLDPDPEFHEYPCVFDTPDFHARETPTLPCFREVQVAAFAQSLEVFASLEESAATDEDGIQFAPRSFIPTGMFASEGEEPASPTASAWFSGEIENVERIQNPFSGAHFYWIQAHTLGGVMDVVADPELVPQEPKVGGLVRGDFWLSGMLHG